MRLLFATIQRQSQHGFKGKQKRKAVEMEGLNQTMSLYILGPYEHYHRITDAI